MTETSGRGVGLAAVAHAVRELSGVVSIESITDQGTRWVLTFPKLENLAEREATAA